MKAISKQKSLNEIKQQVEEFDRIYITGCGTCATMTKTGGTEEVTSMKKYLEDLGKLITGSTVIPTACDEMTEVALKENEEAINNANCVLIMASALGVHRLSLYTDLPVIPALDTLFIGVEDSPGHFNEVCIQCGQCVLGETAGICPITRCAKSLLNGPCGGSSDGKCEISRDIDCAWHLIIERLEALGELERIKPVEMYKDWRPSHSGGPRKIVREDLRL